MEPQPTNETQRKALLDMHQRRLHILQRKIALAGRDARPEDLIESEDIQHAMAALGQSAELMASPPPDRAIALPGETFQHQPLSIRFSPRTDQRYEVLLQSDSAEITGDFELPFSADEIRRFQVNLRHAIQYGTFLRSDEERQTLTQRVQKWGQRLYESLPVRVRERYQAARDSAQGVRLRLNFIDAGLMSLPWEFLYDPNRREFIGLSGQSLVSRYAETGFPTQLEIALPLKVLVVVAAPTDWPELQAQREVARLESGLEPLERHNLVQFRRLDQAITGQPVTVEALHDALFKYRPHVMHFIGHGEFDPVQIEGRLLLETANRQADPLDSARLAQLITTTNSLRLIFLNACESADVSATDRWNSLATALALKGTAAVVALQHPMTDEAAMAFSGKFYQRLAEGAPVDVAVQEARLYLGVVKRNPIEWATPALYLQPRDGHVFRITTRNEAQHD